MTVEDMHRVIAQQHAAALEKIGLVLAAPAAQHWTPQERAAIRSLALLLYETGRNDGADLAALIARS